MGPFPPRRQCLTEGGDRPRLCLSRYTSESSVSLNRSPGQPSSYRSDEELMGTLDGLREFCVMSGESRGETQAASQVQRGGEVRDGWRRNQQVDSKHQMR